MVSKRMLAVLFTALLSTGAVAQPAPPAPPAHEIDHGLPGNDRLTPEQREAKRVEMRKKFENATPEEREKMKAEHRARMEERMKNMTPQEREKFKAEREARRAEWMKNATPEQRAKMEERMKNRGEHDENQGMPQHPLSAPNR